MNFRPIDYIGISTSLPVDIEYFKEELFSHSYNLEENQKNIEQIISVSVDSKILSMKLINTDIRISNEGQRLSGKKLLVELGLTYRVKYLSDSVHKYLYILKGNSTKIVYIVLPSQIENHKIEELIRKKYIGVKAYVEDLYAEVRKKDEVYIRNLILVNVYIKNL